MHIDIIRSRIIKSARRAALNLPYSDQRLKFVNLSWFACKYYVKAKKFISKTSTHWRRALITRELWMEVFANVIMASNQSSLSLDNTRERVISYNQLKALTFLQSQFGMDEKWLQINQAIWGFFQANEGCFLYISDIEQIAAEKNLNFRDFLSVLGLLEHRKAQFIRMVCYRLKNDEEIEEVPVYEALSPIAHAVKHQTELPSWATTTFVGWQLVALSSSLNKKLPNNHK